MRKLGKVGMVMKGAYSSTTSYMKNDVVTYSNKVFCSLVDDNLGNTPADGTSWRLMVDVSSVVTAAQTATTNANTATTKANTAADNANSVANSIINPDLATGIDFNQYVYVQVDGEPKRIQVYDLIIAIANGNHLLLRQVAWGVPVEKSADGEWGVVGNTDLRDAWNAKKCRCMLLNDGRAARMKSDDSNYYEDGTAVDFSVGHVMTWKPGLYILWQQDAVTSQYYLWMSEFPISDVRLEDQMTGAFLAYVKDGKLTSTPNVVPTRSTTISQFWAYARANGDDFGLEDYDFRRYLMLEGLADYGSPNIQTKLGYGVGGSAGNQLYNGGFSTGLTLSLGNGSGTVTISGDSCHVSLHGTEDAWNAEWEMIQGVYFGNSDNADQDGTEMFIYKGNRMPSSTELTTHPDGDYRQIVRLTTSGQYVTRMTLGKYFDLMPTKLGGTSTTWWADYYYANTTGRLLLWGAASDLGSRAGLASVSSANAFSNSYAACGSRLAYYGVIQWVNGADL